MITTLRGHCPCCGNLQAVPNGMSKHGYTVKHGWFQGVCPGANKQPIEIDRRVSEMVIADVLAECKELDQQAADLRSGKIKPHGRTDKKYLGNGKYKFDFTPFAELSPYEQQRVTDEAAYAAESRARSGRSFAKYLGKVVEEFHGKPLIEEEKKAPAAAIRKGDRKLYNGKILMVADYVQGARVYYNGGRSWLGTQAWRRLPDAQ